MKRLKEKIKLSKEEKKENKLESKLRSPWTRFYKDVPKHLNYPDMMMWELIDDASKMYPNYVALEYFGQEITYSKLVSMIHEAARALRALGVSENDVVTICAPNMPQSIVMFYAINMVGAVANMIHPLSAENEILNYLTISNSTFVFSIDVACDKLLNIIDKTRVKKIVVMTANGSMPMFMSVMYWLVQGRKTKVPFDKSNIMSWRDFIDFGYMFNDEYIVKRSKYDPAVILYSGGTTGKPKGILLSNNNFNALAIQSHLMADPSKAGDSVLSIMPIFHGFGLGVCIHTPLICGMRCILIPQFNYKRFGNLIKKHRPNFIVGVPTLYEGLLKNKDIKGNDMSSVTCVVSGGDMMQPELKRKIDRFLEEHGSTAKVRIGYGLTEGSAASCLTPSSEYRDGTIGIPFPDTYYKIVKIGTHDELPYGEDGEICIHGPSVMMGYLNDVKETMQTLREHNDGLLWLHTGDIGAMDEDGFVYFKQRLKRIIISSGYNIYPTYIENVISSHPDVLTCTVIGVDHPYKVQVAKAYIVLKDGVNPTEKIKNEIKELCKKNLAKYSLPSEYEFRDSLPRTLVGKVAFKELADENKNVN